MTGKAYYLTTLGALQRHAAHLALEDDAEFEALPHPLAQRAIPQAAQQALAAYGVAPGATTFDATELVARVHPLLRHRVF
jgi:hypothetical protein